MVEITIKVKDESGNDVTITKTFEDSSLISHNFGKIEGLVEQVRTEMLGDLEREILAQNQAAHIKKASKS